MPKATTSTADAAEELGVHPQKKVPPRRRSVRLRQEEKENASDGRRSNNPNNKRPMADDLGGQSKRANLEEDEGWQRLARIVLIACRRSRDARMERRGSIAESLQGTC